MAYTKENVQDLKYTGSTSYLGGGLTQGFEYGGQSHSVNVPQGGDLYQSVADYLNKLGAGGKANIGFTPGAPIDPRTVPKEISGYNYETGGSINSANLAPVTDLSKQIQTTASVPAFPVDKLDSNPFSYENYYKAHPEAKPGYVNPNALGLSPEQKDLQARLEKIMGLNTQEVGRAGYQAEQEVARNVPELIRLQNDLSSKLKVSQLEAANITAAPQTEAGVTSAIDARQRAEALRLNSVKSLQLFAQLEMAKGNVASAQDAADRAVNLKYAPIEAEIKAQIANTELFLKTPGYTVAEERRAQAVKDAAAVRQAKVDQAKQDAKDIWDDVYVKAVQNGLTDPIALNKIMALRDTVLTDPNAKYKAITLAGTSLRKPADTQVTDKLKTADYTKATQFLTDNPTATYDELKNNIIQNTVLTEAEVDTFLEGQGKTKIPAPPNYVKTATDYKNVGWTRDQIEKQYTDAGKTIPSDFSSALDQVFGAKSSGFKWWNPLTWF